MLPPHFSNVRPSDRIFRGRFQPSSATGPIASISMQLYCVPSRSREPPLQLKEPERLTNQKPIKHTAQKPNCDFPNSSPPFFALSIHRVASLSHKTAYSGLRDSFIAARASSDKLIRLTHLFGESRATNKAPALAVQQDEPKRSLHNDRAHRITHNRISTTATVRMMTFAQHLHRARRTARSTRSCSVKSVLFIGDNFFVHVVNSMYL